MVVIFSIISQLVPVVRGSDLWPRQSLCGWGESRAPPDTCGCLESLMAS